MNSAYKNIEAFFIDLDGTLLDYKKDGEDWLSKENILSWRKAEANGKKLIISTGRSGAFAQPFLDLLRPEYAVLATGAIIWHDGKIIKQINLSKRQVFLLLNFIKKYRLSIKINGEIYSHGVGTKLKKFICRKMGYLPIEEYHFDYNKPIYKLIIWGKGIKKMKKLKKELSETIHGLSVVYSTSKFILEVTNENATKGIANNFVANEFLNIKNKNKIAHIGDTMNDSTTVEFMPLIAMGDAKKSLKKMATFIGPKHKKGGVGKIILNGDFIDHKPKILVNPKTDIKQDKTPKNSQKNT